MVSRYSVELKNDTHGSGATTFLVSPSVATPTNQAGSSIMFLLLVYIILRSGAIIINALGNTIYNLADIVVLLFVFGYLLVNSIKLDPRAVLLFFLFTLPVTLNYFINFSQTNTQYSTYLLIFSRTFLALLLTSVIPFSLFKRNFIVVITILGFISLGFYFLRSPLQEFYYSAPKISITDYANYGNLWLWLYRFDSPDRNGGIFWEPGAFQVFLNFALLFLLTEKQAFAVRTRLVIGFILFLTILTTYSTAGYSVCALFLAIPIVNIRKKLLPKNLMVILMGSTVFILGLFLLIFNNARIVSKFSQEERSYISVERRREGISLDLELIRSNPLFGVGPGDYNDERMQIKATRYEALDPGEVLSSANMYTMIGALFGIFILVFYLLQYARLAWFIGANKLSFGLILSGIILMFSTENFYIYLLPHILAWYGCSTSLQKKERR